MTRDPQSGSTAARASSRSVVVSELRRLEGALQRAHGELLALGGDSLPGLHLVVDAAGRRGLLACARISEVIRLVATTPLVGAAPHVLGTFVCRGAPVLAVDLAALLGASREPPLDAQIVILAGAPAIGIVVDRIERLVDAPRLFEGDASVGTPEGWRGSPVVAGLCIEDGEVLPLVDLSPVLASLAERPA
jgi:purine-binding chemotaxis protein CheW